MQKIPASILTLVAGVLVTLVSVWVGQHHGLLPEQASEQAPLVDGFFNVMITIGTALFLVVEGAIVLFAIQFRQRQGDTGDGVPLEGSVPLEILWTAIPAVIVIGLGIYSVDVYERMGGFDAAMPGMAHHHAPMQTVAQSLPADSAIAAPLITDAGAIADMQDLTGELPKPNLPVFGFGATPQEQGKLPDLMVNVLGLQFAWVFTYPDSGITSGELHIPLGADVKLNISAQDVIHSFWVPQFRLKQDAIPGQPSELRFVATKLGTYPIVCAELCGSYHGGMRTQVVVHTPAEYQTWVTETQIAQGQEAVQTVAMTPSQRSDAQFLAPYGEELGVTAHALAPLHSH